MALSIRNIAYSFLCASLPVAVFAFSGGPPIKRTGAPVDDAGANCTACHRTFAPAVATNNAGPFKIEAGSYKPGIKQMIKVTIADAEAMKWGFQMTARTVRDETKAAGTFTPTGDIRVRCDPAGNDAPCNGALEFASHNATSTAAGTTGGKTFEVEWTPPEGNEVGDVIFYAAGNAANNNNANAGDRIFTTSLRIQADAACPLTTRPTLRTVGNAASFQPAMSINTLVTLFGLNFQTPGTRREANAGDIRDNKFPKELGCVAVEIAGQRVPLYYAQNDQINAQIPTITQTGNVEVRVITNPGKPNELRSDVATIALQNFSPAFFAFNGKSVAARHPDFSIAADPSVVAGGKPIKPGDVVLLFATGLGASEPVYQAGEVSPAAGVRTKETVTVTIGGTAVPAADILFVGVAPTSITGLYQLNVRTPATAPDGDIPITITVGGVTSPTGTTIPMKR